MKIEQPENVIKKEKVENFTYNKGIVATGDGYTFELPDNFVVIEGEEDRDFIAYIPDEADPQNYLSSRFIIFAGHRSENKEFGQFRIAEEYAAIVHGMGKPLNSRFARSWASEYLRKDLPGAIIYGYDPGYLHANAFFGIDDHMQTMRMQVECMDVRKRDEYAEIVKELFDHMKARRQVKALDDLDSEEFVSMALDTKAIKKWEETVAEYVYHILVVRNIKQSFIDSDIENLGIVGISGYNKIKKDIKNMLYNVSQIAEKVLIKAEALYILKYAQYPGDSKLKSMLDAINCVISLTKQEANINDDHVAVKSDYARIAKKHIKENAGAYIDEILNTNEDKLSSELVAALKEANGNYKKLYQEATERKRKEELEHCNSELETSNARLREIEIELEKYVKKKTEIDTEFSHEKKDFEVVSKEIQPQIDALQAKIIELDKSLLQGNNKLKSEETKSRAEMSKRQDELKKAVVMFEVKQDIALVYREKADKNKLFKKKANAEYEKKQQAADSAKAIVEKLKEEFEQIEINLKESSAQMTQENNLCTAQRADLQRDLDQLTARLTESKNKFDASKTKHDMSVDELGGSRKKLEKEKSKLEKYVAKLEKEKKEMNC